MPRLLECIVLASLSCRTNNTRSTLLSHHLNIRTYSDTTALHLLPCVTRLLFLLFIDKKVIYCYQYMMSPRRPHLRNRKKIKAPKRFEDEYGDDKTSPTRQESPEEVHVSEESSELEEEIYEPPKPKTPKSKNRPAYRGKVTEFNPNLPPAAFPTLDHPSYVHNGGTVAIDLESHSLGSKSQELEGHEAVNPDPLDRDPHPEEADLTEKFPVPTPTTADFTHRNSQFGMQGSEKGQKQARGNIWPSSVHGGPNDNGPQNPIWASNMARMVEAGKMSDLDRIMLEMETSDEEDAATDRRSKFARKNSTQKFPAWDDLTVTHKLDLADAIAEFYPDPEHVMHQLRLNPSQKKELVELLIERQGRAAREEANQQTSMNQTKEMLLRGEPLAQAKFHQMEENLYENIQEDHHIQTNLVELKKARAYLGHCGLDPALADSNWDVPPIPNVAEPEPAQAPLRPSEEEESSSSRPALSTSFQEAPHLPDPHPELGQQQQPQALASQYRPSTAPHAQQSPLAPLFSAPIRPHRVVPTPYIVEQSDGKFRFYYPRSRTRPAQHQQSSSNLSAVQSNNALSSTTKNRPKARAATSPHILFKDLDEENSQPMLYRSHVPAHEDGLPVAQGDQQHQRITDSNAGTSARQGRLGFIGDRGSANRNRKKGAN